MYGSLINSLIIGALTVWPLARILQRAGLHQGWALLAFVPLVGLLAVAGVLALSHWPRLPPAPPRPQPKQRAV
ncbi:MAG TPA: hypothetical protein VK943_12385 [Arenibaculum sp.]|nr:hypothetical protein [Arenibaculum sp.]